MIKYFISFILFCVYGFAGLVGGISMTVDNEPITLYEIKSFSKHNNVSTQDAVNRLIQMKIEDIEIRKMGIFASPYDVQQKMQEIAKQNNMSLETFKKALAAEGLNEKGFRHDIEEKIKRDKLYEKIVGSNLKKPDEDELRSYYDLNQDKFNMPKTIDVLEYLSTSKEALEIQKKQPMVNMPNISVTTKTLDLASINPQLAQLLAQTPDGSFTPVLNLGTQNATFFIQKKSGQQNISFDMAKQGIFAQLMHEREQATLIEYFEKRKSEANIKVVREPN